MNGFTDLDMDVVPPRSERDEIAEIARLIEESSLGTPEARRLRDLAEPTTTDRVVSRAYFAKTAAGAEWWAANQRDPAALAHAACILCRDGDDQERVTAQRLLRLAAACTRRAPDEAADVAGNGSVGHPAPASAAREQRSDGEVEAALPKPPASPALLPALPRAHEDAGRRVRQVKNTVTFSHGGISDAFRQFGKILDDALRPRMDEIEATRRRLRALTDALDLWEAGLQDMPRPELWVLGRAFSRDTGPDDPGQLLKLGFPEWGHAASWTDRMSDTYLRGVLVVISENLDVEAPTLRESRYINQLWRGDGGKGLNNHRHRETGDFAGREGCDQDIRALVELTALLIAGSPSRARSATEVLSTAFWRIDTRWGDHRRTGLDCKVVFSNKLVNQIRAFQRADRPGFGTVWDQSDVLHRLTPDILMCSADADLHPAPVSTRLADWSVQEAFERLEPREREALVLCYHSGFELAKTAQVMGLAEPVVQHHLERARTKIGTWLVTQPTERRKQVSAALASAKHTPNQEMEATAAEQSGVP